MTVLFDCPWCEDEIIFDVDESRDDVVCSVCNGRMAFAPDPAVTLSILYGAQAA